MPRTPPPQLVLNGGVEDGGERENPHHHDYDDLLAPRPLPQKAQSEGVLVDVFLSTDLIILGLSNLLPPRPTLIKRDN